MKNIIILDTESTGFTEPRPIEVAYVQIQDLETLKILKKFEKRYNPDKPSELGALMTHNILDSELINCDSWETAILPEDTEYIIGHNIDYDWRVLREPNIKRICTQALSDYLLPDLDSHRQSALLYFFEGDAAREKLLQAHSALPDVMNCRLVLKHLLKLLKDRFPELIETSLTIHELWTISEEARIPTIMRFGKHKGELIKNIPYGYKSWLLKQEDVDPYLRKALTRK